MENKDLKKELSLSFIEKLKSKKPRRYTDGNLTLLEIDGYIDTHYFLYQINKPQEEILNEKEFLWYSDFIEKYKRYLDDVDTLRILIEENLFYDYYFIKRPPSPVEFLDYHNGWINKGLYKSLYDEVKQDFINILTGNYDTISMYGATRIGKSYLSRLLILYTIVYMNHIKKVDELFSIALGTKLKIYIMSFDFNKTNEVYVAPLHNIMENLRERYTYVKMQSKLQPFDGNTIYWTKASLNKNINLNTFNIELLSGNTDVFKMLGSDLLQTYISEISFFIEKKGVKEADILNLYIKSLERIRGTAENSFLSYVYLDTSANREDSIIEDYILKNIKDDPKCYFVWRKRWDIKQKKYQECPVYSETGKVFYLYLGDGTNDPFISKELDNRFIGLPKDRIIEVPIDYWDSFYKYLTISIRDIAGFPTRVENRFISSDKAIEDIFVDYRWNISSSIIVDISNTKNIFELIKDHLFVEEINDTYRLKERPNIPRFIGLDLSKSPTGDTTGICMLYVVKNPDKTHKYICDFCFGIRGKENVIDLESIFNFILDLYTKGKVKIEGVFADMSYSEYLLQGLKKKGIRAENQSVVRSSEQYLYLAKKIYEKNIEVGRNIILKNNLKSLVEINGKIDHTIGDVELEYNGDWENSLCGKNQKDVSDALCQAVYGAYKIGYEPVEIDDEIDDAEVIKNVFFNL
ncbi:MAG: hypothetical protein QW350_05080 [Candidatus Aenigmatarchaeota archaeon]